MNESNSPFGLRVVYRHISRKKSRVYTRLSCRLNSDKLIPLSVIPLSRKTMEVVRRVGGLTLNEFIGTIKSVCLAIISGRYDFGLEKLQ